MTDRHYNDDEVAAIFRAAAEDSQSRMLPDGRAEGLTLRDLQAAALDAGISPDAVARAAQSLDRQSAPPPVSQTFLGFPVSVQRTAPLSRRLTDEEWELLVVELRQVFNARGIVRVQGSMREWSNGNLHAFLEPTRTGYQFRLGTFKGQALPSVVIGSMVFGMSAVLSAIASASGKLAQGAPMLAVMAVFGIGLAASGVLRLPAWARLRRQQIDGVVERLTLATQDERGARTLLSDAPNAERGR
jgi:hypothetical protein